ncbi:hypothetical protein T02_305 [Trichinella nativa]|uniref:Uncharacterized protein n=1 Tax=Trichinella nativa TaxID=6335 RepID=A0A0V1LIL4_9BILA|nr:hypothetical protein T02_305 [Trichinella nativa]
MEKKAILRKPSAKETKLSTTKKPPPRPLSRLHPASSRKLQGLLASGDFHLHKWISNEPEVLKSVLDEKDPSVPGITC